MITVCVPIKDRSSLNIEKMNLGILGEYVLLINDIPGRANARNALMRQVMTEWFLFIDDDIEINSDWWKKIRKNMNNERAGAISGLGYTRSWILRFARKALLAIRGAEMQRGFTSNTLIRTAAINDITLERAGRLEDIELQEKVSEKGYEWILCQDAECRHLKLARTVLREAWGDFKELLLEKGLVDALRRI